MAEKEIKQADKKVENKSVNDNAAKNEKIKTIDTVSKTDAPNISESKVITTESKDKSTKTVEKPKKTEVSAAGLNLHASLKHCMYISRFIKNKTIGQAILDLEDVIKFKKIVPFRGEIPHRKGKGMMSGRYPIATSKQIISVLKGLKGNALAAGFDIDKTRITFANPSWASLPPRKGGGRFKRSNIYFRARESSEPIKFSKKRTLKEIMRRRT